ncbi:MAG: DUF998 domain-containing protein [Nitrososphaerota archaeon]|nr:DUF998 domain-containing protein [Candidatus Bathyarchaeota archaeon]MDW8048828.1 DUF998 domain-containing protein [Nitrososphaerota archaeon]
MKIKPPLILGILGPLVAYIFIWVSISSSPWFSWYKNALSDLGHAGRSSSAPFFNFGLALSGFINIIYACTVFRRHAKYTSYCLAFSAFMLQLVSVFDEIYGFIHFIVSVCFFISAAISCLVYAVEKRSFFALIAFVIGLSSWVLYWLGIYKAGVAVPEIISAIAVTSCIFLSVWRIGTETDAENKANVTVA